LKKCNHNYEGIKLPDKPTVFIQAGTGGESHYDIKGYRSDGGVEFQAIMITALSN